MYHYGCVPTWGAQQGCWESMVGQIEEGLSLCHLLSLGGGELEEAAAKSVKGKLSISRLRSLSHPLL